MSFMLISYCKYWNVTFFAIGLAMNFIIYLLRDSNTITPITRIQYQFIDDHKTKIQNSFLSNIDDSQSNCLNERFLLFQVFGDGFANYHHYMGQALLLAVSTNRTLYFYGNFHYYGKCKNHSISDNWYCIYDPFTSCSVPQNIKYKINEKLSQLQITENKRRLVALVHPNDGTLQSPLQNGLYSRYFGAEPLVEYSFKKFFWNNGIYNQKWFNKFDNVFIRSHVQYYIWLKMNNKVKNIVSSSAMIKKIQSLHDRKEKYIAFHFRKSDNVVDVYHMYGIVADKTYNMKHYMNIVKENIDIKDNALNTIFVCTDSTEIINDIENNYARNNSEWNFLYNSKTKRSSTRERNWFLNDMNDNDLWNVIIDIELLRLADYLVGPATSNVFRLGMELNYATHWTQKHALFKQNIFSVDIPWMQDP